MLFFASNSLMVFHVIQSNGQDPDMATGLYTICTQLYCQQFSDPYPTTLTLPGVQIYELFPL